jgi:hypothetical protein
VVMPAAGMAAMDTVARSLALGCRVGVRTPENQRAPGRGYHASHLGGGPRGADSRGTQLPRGAGAGAAPEVVVQPGHQCPPPAEGFCRRASRRCWNQKGRRQSKRRTQTAQVPPQQPPGARLIAR